MVLHTGFIPSGNVRNQMAVFVFVRECEKIVFLWSGRVLKEMAVLVFVRESQGMSGNLIKSQGKKLKSQGNFFTLDRYIKT